MKDLIQRGFPSFKRKNFTEGGIKARFKLKVKVGLKIQFGACDPAPAAPQKALRRHAAACSGIRGNMRRHMATCGGCKCMVGGHDEETEISREHRTSEVRRIKAARLER